MHTTMLVRAPYLFAHEKCKLRLQSAVQYLYFRLLLRFLC